MDNNFPIPYSRGFRVKDNERKCSVNIGVNEEFKINDVILHTLIARVTGSNDTTHEFETLYDPEQKLIEVDIPSCFLDFIEEVEVGPNIKRYFKWLIDIDAFDKSIDTSDDIVEGVTNLFLTTTERSSIAGAEQIVNKNVALGYPGLDINGKISSSQMPSIALSEYLGNFADVTAALADADVQASQLGDWFTTNADGGGSWIVTTTNPTILSDVTKIATPITSIFGRTGIVTAQAGDYTAAQITNAFDTANQTSDAIIEGTTNLFLTSAERIILGNTSGTNTGDVWTEAVGVATYIGNAVIANSGSSASLSFSDGATTISPKVGSVGNNLIFTNGNIGVGTTIAPAAKQEIVSATTQLRLSGTDYTNDYTNFFTNTDGELEITSTGGRVGINTNPAYALHVYEGAVNNVARFETNGSATKVFFVNAGSTGLVTIGSESDNIDFRTDNGDISFSASDTGSEIERMRLKKTGLLGIGTVSPANRLHIKGTVADIQKIESTAAASNLIFADINTTTSPKVGSKGDILNFTVSNEVVARATGAEFDAYRGFGIGMASGNAIIIPHDDEAYGVLATTGKNASFYTGVGPANAQVSFAFTGADVTSTASVSTLLLVARTFAPTTGTSSYNFQEIRPTVNQSVGVGVSRGLYINPTLTSAVDFRGIDIANVGATQIALKTGTGRVELGGNVLIGTTSDSGTKLNVAGAITINSTNAVNSANYTILDDDNYSDIDFTTGAVDRVCTLPTLSDNIGRIIWVSKVDAGAGKVTVTCEGSDTFLDGSTTSMDLLNIGETIAIKGSTNGWKLF